METTNAKKLESISKQLETLTKEFSAALGNDEIKSNLIRLYRRSKEYKNGSFIMLVVGPVKSGKSTLVNLLAHRYVSPTDKLECTIRPSIISCAESHEECSIEVYTAKDENRKEEDLDLIIDKLRGIIEDESEIREHLTKEVFPLNNDNINAYITPSYNKGDNSIITSISTTGSKLLKSTDSGKIFIADMPGFDGNRVNLSNSLYDAISKRVDLILFVHSSVSAFNVTSNEYLEKLREYNGTVPVFLIHNIFDANFWKNKETRLKDVERQSKNEYDEIKSKGFNIEPDYISCINLGMVTDYINKDENCLPEFDEELKKEYDAFENIEEKLYNKITTNISKLRLDRCLDRTEKLKNDLIELIKRNKAALKNRKEDKDSFENAFASLDKITGLTSTEIEEIIDNVASDANRFIFRSQAKSRVNKSMSTKECMACLRQILTSFLANVDERLTDKLFRHYSLKQKEVTERINSSLNSPINEVSLTEITAETVNNISDESVKSFMKTSNWDWFTDFTIGHSYKAETVRNSISNMERWFYGDENEKDTTNLKMLLKEEIKRMAKLYQQQIKEELQNQLQNFISDEELKTLSSLENLQVKLENIII
ncbi:MAG: dynamin family protein [Paludibacteraceae bacterium]|jgi:GTPase Era involved in 16S rRNA processing|nr:dynamin family protein [Paludibacteraceae bacterium]